MSDKIRLGIVGCGGIARNRHITGMTELKNAGLDNFEVTACCDVVDDNVQAVAAHARDRQGANPRIYHDWEEMLSTAPIDAVDICLPHGMHHVVGISALQAGLHVLVEKPYTDRKSTRLNSSHANISYACFCLKKKKKRTVGGMAWTCCTVSHVLNTVIEGA